MPFSTLPCTGPINVCGEASCLAGPPAKHRGNSWVQDASAHRVSFTHTAGSYSCSISTPGVERRPIPLLLHCYCCYACSCINSARQNHLCCSPPPARLDHDRPTWPFTPKCMFVYTWPAGKGCCSKFRKGN